MTPDSDQLTALLGELRGLLIDEGLTEGVNLHLSERDGVVQVQLMAVDLGRLGLLLAVLSNPAELADEDSFSRRIASGRNDGEQGRWQYSLAADRYPINGEIVFLGKIKLPAGDVPEIIARVRERG